MRYINLADHPIKIKGKNGVVKFPANKQKPLLISKSVPVGGDGEIVEFVQIYQDILHLPEKKEGVKYIVPLFILDALQRFQANPNCPEHLKDRDDVVSPGKKVLGRNGKVLYAEGLKVGTGVIDIK
jgi:hypothetical protein